MVYPAAFENFTAFCPDIQIWDQSALHVYQRLKEDYPDMNTMYSETLRIQRLDPDEKTSGRWISFHPRCIRIRLSSLTAKRKVLGAKTRVQIQIQTDPPRKRLRSTARQAIEGIDR